MPRRIPVPTAWRLQMEFLEVIDLRLAALLDPRRRLSVTARAEIKAMRALINGVLVREKHRAP